MADSIVASAGSLDGQGASVLLVLQNDEGLAIAGGWDSLGMRGNQSNPMSLQSVELPLAERLIGGEGQGADIMLGRALPGEAGVWDELRRDDGHLRPAWEAFARALPTPSR
jgi:alkylation response protein AidB-like acyl-CoA dehydrogenase